MPNSDAVPAADQVVEQMRAATDRLREQAWMVAPPTAAVREPTRAEASAPKS